MSSIAAFPKPLNVAIVGAGLGGLTATIALRRQGHIVKVFESSQLNREIGAALCVPPNALRVLATLGYSQKNLRSSDFRGMVVYSPYGSQLHATTFKDQATHYGVQGVMCHRSDLHDELKRLALGDERAGNPALLALTARFPLMAHVDGDILSHIFALTDVYTILSLSRVNKLFRSAAFTKQLWLSVVRDLASRWLIDSPGDEILETLSTHELINEVKRGVVGARTWSPTSSAPPSVARKITLPQEIPSSHVLLPAGTHIVAYDTHGGAFSRGVECWEMKTGRRVWGWAAPNYLVHQATFDIRRGGSEAVVSVVNAMHEHNHIIIFQVDLETGDSRDVCHLPIDAAFPPRIRICGDFFTCEALVRQTAWPSIVALVNWRTGKFIGFGIDYHQDTVLFPGHIALGCPASGAVSRIDFVRIYSMASLHHLWRPISDFSLDTLSDITRIGSVVIHLACNSVRVDPWWHRVEISVAESTVHDNTYELVARVVDSAYRSRVMVLLKRIQNRLTNRPAPAPPNEKITTVTLSRYRIGVPPTTSSSPALPQLTLKSVLRHRRLFPYTSRTGYAMSWRELGPLRWPREIHIHRLDKKGVNKPRKLMLDEASLCSVQMSQTCVVMASNGSHTVLYHYL
ncbi:hypothetical protein B0H10DRAFT_1939418 [Mycena sp. CBHHK59/15]|nr:hypothetical protein B0H10DRAFT_1939418 [Mycena sp. CBHHK59/15]